MSTGTGAGWESAAGRLGPGAEWYASQGWKVFPTWGIVGGKCGCGKSHPEPKDMGKHPHGRLVADGQKSATSDVEAVREWWAADPDANVGVACGESGFIVVDIDPRNGGIGSFALLEELLEKDGECLPDTVSAVTGEYTTPGGAFRGRHLFYKVEAGESLRAAVPGLKGIDVKHNGYVLIAPSRHASGLVYEWEAGKAPWEIEMAPAPEALLKQLRKRPPGGVGGGGIGAGVVIEMDGEKLDVEAVLAEGIHEGERDNTLHKIACSMANDIDPSKGWMVSSFKATIAGINKTRVFPPLDESDVERICRQALKFVEDNPKNQIMSFPEMKEWQATIAPLLGGGGARKEASSGTEITALPAVAGAGAGGGGGGGEGSSESTRVPDLPLPPDPDNPFREPSTGEETGVLKRTLTDVGNGRRFADYWGEQTKHSEGLGWFCWDGQYWAPDGGMVQTRERAKDLFSITVREAATYTDPDKTEAVTKFAMSCKSMARINAAISASESDPRVNVDVSVWDDDDYLLGVKNGVVDLRTGNLVSGDPRYYITKRCRVAYTPGMRNVRFEQFLDYATEGDKEFQDWLQRAAGLTLSGRREQDVLFLVHGLPGTGKNTLVEALFLLLDSYAYSLDADLLMARRQPTGQDQYHYAEMLGKRMMWVDELPEAERMKDDKVKKLTGSETIEGRRPMESPITFKSRGKLWISTNHKPPIRDDAMWRRIRPIPFNHVPEKPDPTLKPYIFDPDGALPAVLSWAVDGAVKYFGSASVDGLGWCKKVWDDAEFYRAAEDTIGIFLDEETRKGEGVSVTVQQLYSVYKVWADDRGEKPMTVRPFATKISERVGETVEGLGKHAIVKNRMLVPRLAESSGSTPWDSLIRSAR